MNVSGVMSNYFSSSYLRTLKNDSSSSASLLTSVDSAVSSSYSIAGLSGKSETLALQDIYASVQEDYGINLTYDANGNIVSNETTTDELPTLSSFTNSLNANLLSVFDSQNCASTSSLISLFSQYNFSQSISHSVSDSLYASQSTDVTAAIGSMLDITA